MLKNSWGLLAPPSSLQKQVRLPLTIVFLVFTYQFDFWNEVSDRWKGDVPWLKMSFGKTAAYGECCERPILKKISAVSVPPRVPILLHPDYQRTDSCFFFFCERDL